MKGKEAIRTGLYTLEEAKDYFKNLAENGGRRPEPEMLEDSEASSYLSDTSQLFLNDALEKKKTSEAQESMNSTPDETFEESSAISPVREMPLIQSPKLSHAAVASPSAKPTRNVDDMMRLSIPPTYSDVFKTALLQCQATKTNEQQQPDPEAEGLSLQESFVQFLVKEEVDKDCVMSKPPSLREYRKLARMSRKKVALNATRSPGNSFLYRLEEVLEDDQPPRDQESLVDKTNQSMEVNVSGLEPLPLSETFMDFMVDGREYQVEDTFQSTPYKQGEHAKEKEVSIYVGTPTIDEAKRFFNRSRKPLHQHDISLPSSPDISNSFAQFLKASKAKQQNQKSPAGDEMNGSDVHEAK